MYQEEYTAVQYLLYHSILGICMGLAIWTHPLTYPYIAVAGGLVLVKIVRTRFRLDLIISLVITGILSITGLLPTYFATGSLMGMNSNRLPVKWDTIQAALSNLTRVNIKELVVWNFIENYQSKELLYLVKYGSLVILGTASVIALFSFFTSRKALFERRFYLVPLSFFIVFLLLYVQHHLAVVKAPRYAIGIWTILLCTIWSAAHTISTEPRLRGIVSVLFGVWLVIQLSGTLLFIKGSNNFAVDERRRMQMIVDTAKQKGLKREVLYGDDNFGYKAQKLSMFAQNNVIFASSGLERYAKNAQFTELDNRNGYLVNETSRVPLTRLFHELNVEYDMAQIGSYTLFYNTHEKNQLTMWPVPYSVPAPSENERINERSLYDGSPDTGIDVKKLADGQLILDTGRVQLLHGIWMFTKQNPYDFGWNRLGPYTISLSSDGHTYRTVLTSFSLTGKGYYSGQHLFVDGVLGKVDALFPPDNGRFIKIEFPPKSQSAVKELMVFSTDGTPVKPDKNTLDSVIDVIESEELEFIWADRRVSAQILDYFNSKSKGKFMALPRQSTRFEYQPAKYFIQPEKGNGVVCEAVLAEYCRQRLTEQYGKRIISKERGAAGYTLFILEAISQREVYADRSALLWNGHAPVRTSDMDILARWFSSIGAPVWAPHFVKKEGFYHDSWTNGKGRLKNLDYSLDGCEKVDLILITNGWNPVTNPQELRLRMIINKNISLELKDFRQNTYVYEIPKNLDYIDSLEIHSTTFIPPGPDTRELGMDVKRVEVRHSSPEFLH